MHAVLNARANKCNVSWGKMSAGNRAKVRLNIRQFSVTIATTMFEVIVNSNDSIWRLLSKWQGRDAPRIMWHTEQGSSTSIHINMLHFGNIKPHILNQSPEMRLSYILQEDINRIRWANQLYIVSNNVTSWRDGQAPITIKKSRSLWADTSSS